MVTCNVFLRDIPKVLGTGLIVGHDLVGRVNGIAQDDSSIELTLKKTTIISQILSYNLVDSIDILTSISVISVVINLLTSFTTFGGILSEGIYRFPLILFAVILIVCIAVQCMALQFKKPDSNE